MLTTCCPHPGPQTLVVLAMIGVVHDHILLSRFFVQVCAGLGPGKGRAHRKVSQREHSPETLPKPQQLWSAFLCRYALGMGWAAPRPRVPEMVPSFPPAPLQQQALALEVPAHVRAVLLDAGFVRGLLCRLPGVAADAPVIQARPMGRVLGVRN